MKVVRREGRKERRWSADGSGRTGRGDGGDLGVRWAAKEELKRSRRAFSHRVDFVTRAPTSRRKSHAKPERALSRFPLMSRAAHVLWLRGGGGGEEARVQKA